jgi:hypothetical protein
MGYTVLYIAFGVVALWLLGEVLLQYKARLRWRLLAFAGFLAVVAGVYLPEVIVIAIGAAAFGTGQTFVTLSYRKGFEAGWALRRPRHDNDGETSGPYPGSNGAAAAQPEWEPLATAAASGRTPSAGETMVAAGAPYAEDAEEVTPFGVGYDRYDQTSTTGGGSTRVFQPMPMQEDSGEFAVHDARSSYTSDYTSDPYANGGYQGYGAQGYDGWDGGQQQPAAAYDGSYGWGGPEQGQGGYGGYGPGDQQHSYTDPYAGHAQDYGQGQQQAHYQPQGQYQGRPEDPYQNQNQDRYQNHDQYQGGYQNEGQYQYQGQQGQGQGPYGYGTSPEGGWTPGDQQAYDPQPQDSQYEQQSRYRADPNDPYRYQG